MNTTPEATDEMVAQIERWLDLGVASVYARPTAISAILARLRKAEAERDATNDGANALLDALRAAEAREADLRAKLKTAREALGDIAKQKLHAEVTDSDPDELDWLGGFEECVHRARTAHEATRPAGEKESG